MPVKCFCGVAFLSASDTYELTLSIAVQLYVPKSEKFSSATFKLIMVQTSNCDSIQSHTWCSPPYTPYKFKYTTFAVFWLRTFSSIGCHCTC